MGRRTGSIQTNLILVLDAILRSRHEVQNDIMSYAQDRLNSTLDAAEEFYQPAYDWVRQNCVDKDGNLLNSLETPLTYMDSIGQSWLWKYARDYMYSESLECSPMRAFVEIGRDDYDEVNLFKKSSH